MEGVYITCSRGKVKGKQTKDSAGHYTKPEDAAEYIMGTKVDRMRELAKGGRPAPVPQRYHPLFRGSTHATLMAVSGAESSRSSPVPVNVRVLNASDNSMVHMVLDKSDTVGKLKEMFLRERPDLSGSLQLACNGKPAAEHQTLEALHLKESALFVTFQKCVGG
ncbi:hypothetical protein SKAU_G00392940 [Synaphobranchus kaupii]|uniref:Ubiquitin-like domain-containing protein n=1 Tax=Synaphobranchus kaupii TaxID=118154 RepID=A0A9Q1EBX7_SYNKA|nr:hypothetical protein SKAU_G00392940 [Synaphobranchus kaupii]